MELFFKMQFAENVLVWSFGAFTVSVFVTIFITVIPNYSSKWVFTLICINYPLKFLDLVLESSVIDVQCPHLDL